MAHLNYMYYRLVLWLNYLIPAPVFVRIRQSRCVINGTKARKSRTCLVGVCTRAPYKTQFHKSHPPVSKCAKCKYNY